MSFKGRGSHQYGRRLSCKVEDGRGRMKNLSSVHTILRYTTDLPSMNSRSFTIDFVFEKTLRKLGQEWTTELLFIKISPFIIDNHPHLHEAVDMKISPERTMELEYPLLLPSPCSISVVLRLLILFIC